MKRKVNIEFFGKKINFSIRNVIRIVWISGVITFTARMGYSYQSRNVDEVVLDSDENVSVIQKDDLIIFEPNTNIQNKTFLFLPGGLVDPKAYTPMARNIALEGVKVIIVKMPLRLANLGYRRVLELINKEPDTQYFVGGHSQGGKMAAQLIYENPGVADGLILIGTTHPRDIDLSHLNIPVMKLAASNDGVADLDEIKFNLKNLPGNAQLKVIEGGNHSQFGYYGNQLRDNKATISLEQQQQSLVDNMVSF